MSLRQPVRLLENTLENLQKAYPLELLADFSTGAFTLVKRDGSTLTHGKPGKLTVKQGSTTLISAHDMSEDVTINLPENSATSESADKLTNSRTIGLSGAATGTATAFDGSKNITIPVTSLDATKLSGVAPASSIPNLPYSKLTDTPTIYQPSASTDTPKVAGTAAIGTSTKFARADHVHPVQTSVSGNAGTATKMATDRSFTIGSATAKSFNNSTSLSWSLSDIGVDSAISQAINNLKSTIDNDVADTYFKKSGGEVSGSITPNANGTLNLGSSTNKFSTVYGNTFSGNAGTATKLASKVALKIGNKSYDFDGSSAITWSLSDIGAATSGHNHDSVYLKLSGGEIVGPITPNANGTINLGAADKAFANVYATTFTGALSGNASTASRLAASKNFNLGGVTTSGPVAFNGSDNVVINVTAVPASLLTGTIDIARLPASAIETIKVVTNDAARLALTKSDVQNGDTVKVNGTGQMYFVKDDSKLGTEDAFEPYTATAASSVPWTGVTGKPNFATVATSGSYNDLSNRPTIYQPSSATPKVASGSGTVGTSTAFARGDHVHPVQTSVSGNAGTATKLAGAVALKIGNKSYDFDGSAPITWTLSDIGAATSGHTHNYAGSSSEGGSATKAIGDKNGKDITSYISGATVSGRTITLNRGSGTDPITLTTQDTTYSKFTGATADNAGSNGLVPAPAKGATTLFLKSDGTWASPANTTYGVFAIGANGLVPAPTSADAAKVLNGAGQWVAQTSYANATQSVAGLLSADDKKKLDGITASADSVAFTQTLTSGYEIGSISINGGTAVKLYGKNFTDTNTTYTFATGTANGTFSVTPSNGTATNIAIKGLGSAAYTNSSAYATSTHNHDSVYSKLGHSHNAMGAASADSAGTAGFVPAPAAGDQNKVLNGAGQWVAQTSYGTATTSAAGLMSSTDKSKLNGISSGANKVTVTQTQTSGYEIGKLTIDSGTPITLYGKNFTNTTYTLATGTENGKIKVTPSSGSAYEVSVYGLKSAAYTESSAYAPAVHDHDDAYLPLSGGTLTGNLSGKYIIGTWLQITSTTDLGSSSYRVPVLDGDGWVYYRTQDSVRSDLVMTAASADAAGKGGFVPAPASGKQNSFLRGDGTWATPKDTYYISHLYVNNSSTKNAQTTTALTNGNVYLHLCDDSYHRNSVKLTGSGATTVITDASGNITINSTDNNTTYSAGTGISLSGTTFSNSGVRSIATGGTNGTISVNTNGTSANVAVKGLGSAAYTASTAYMGASTVASSSTLGGIKIGYTESGKNYPVELDSNNKAYVNVPWTDNNTDTKVTQTLTSTNAAYPLLLAPSAQSATTTTTAYFDSGVTLNPSTNTIAANISGNAATATTATTANGVAWGNVTGKPSSYYTLPTAGSTLGGVKTTSTVTSTSGLTACPIISGVPYYKDTNTTYSNFVKSGSSAKNGLVPAPPTTAGTTKYLREDGTWATPPDTNTTYSLSSFGITATAAELNYCDGVTSNIQTQLGTKFPTAGGTLTGTLTSRAITVQSGYKLTVTTAGSVSGIAVQYSATVGTSWSGSGPYTQTITVSGITASDVPIVDFTCSGTYATDKAREEAFGKIYRITTAANSITVYAHEKTTTSCPIILRCIR